MTVTDLASDQLADTALDAGRAAAAALPGGTGWAVEPVDGSAPAPVPSGGSAVSVDLGPSGRLVIVASSALSRAVQVGPPPAEDLLEGLQSAFDAAAQAVAATGAAVTPTAPVLVPGDPTAAVTAGPGEVAHGARLLDGADHTATVVLVAPAPPAGEPVGHQFPDLDAPRSNPAAGGPLELLQEVEMGVTAELGRTRLLVREILDLSPGSVIELDRAAGSPVDVLVNGTLIARGEVVVIDEEFGIRVTEVIGYDDGSGRPRS